MSKNIAIYTDKAQLIESNNANEIHSRQFVFNQLLTNNDSKKSKKVPTPSAALNNNKI